jgi:hypothetical protein
MRTGEETKALAAGMYECAGIHSSRRGPRHVDGGRQREAKEKKNISGKKKKFERGREKKEGERERERERQRLEIFCAKE